MPRTRRKSLASGDAPAVANVQGAARREHDAECYICMEDGPGLKYHCPECTITAHMKCAVTFAITREYGSVAAFPMTGRSHAQISCPNGHRLLDVPTLIRTYSTGIEGPNTRSLIHTAANVFLLAYFFFLYQTVERKYYGVVGFTLALTWRFVHLMAYEGIRFPDSLKDVCEGFFVNYRSNLFILYQIAHFYCTLAVADVLSPFMTWQVLISIALLASQLPLIGSYVAGASIIAVWLWNAAALDFITTSALNTAHLYGSVLILVVSILLQAIRFQTRETNAVFDSVLQSPEEAEQLTSV